MFDFLISVKELFENKVGNKVTFYSNNDNLNISVFDVAIVAFSSKQNSNDANKIRDELFKFYFPENIDVLDFGNIIEDLDYNIFLEQIVFLFEQATQNNLKLIVIGEKEKYNIGFFKNYLNKTEKLSFVSVGSEIKFNQDDSAFQNCLNYLSQNNNIVESMTHLGYQNFLVNPSLLEYFKEKKYKAFRLSDIKSDFLDFEPYFRRAGIVSMNLDAVKYSDSPGVINPLPAGFDTTEYCKLSYFAGFNKSLKVFGIYNYVSANDVKNISAKLFAQTLWHFLESLSESKKIFIDNKKDYSVHHLFITNDKKGEQVLKFMHYDKIDLWWLAVEVDGYEQLVPCSFKDYNDAKKGLISKRIELILEEFDI
ncbi:MAG: hypothetical protein U9Q83_06690 [Bacteroidota bacterium]|nr:hypothetical protein [Bacteroidota bacterium]